MYPGLEFLKNRVLQCAKIGFCLDTEWLNRHKIGKREESLRRIGCHFSRVHMGAGSYY